MEFSFIEIRCQCEFLLLRLRLFSNMLSLNLQRRSLICLKLVILVLSKVKQYVKDKE